MLSFCNPFVLWGAHSLLKWIFLFWDGIFEIVWIALWNRFTIPVKNLKPVWGVYFHLLRSFGIWVFIWGKDTFCVLYTLLFTDCPRLLCTVAWLKLANWIVFTRTETVCILKTLYKVRIKNKVSLILLL